MTYRKFLKTLARVAYFSVLFFSFWVIFNFVAGITESFGVIIVRSVVAAVIIAALRSWQNKHFVV